MADTERKAFEKAMNDSRFFPRELDFSRTKSPSGRDEYANSHLQSNWEGWQARAAIASRPAEVDDERQWVIVGGQRAGRTFLAALARDAERYRWMRNAQWFKAGIAKTELNASSFHYSGDLLDQLVDAGRAAGAHGEGANR